MAVTTVANQIRAGQIDIGLAVGVESMTGNPDKGSPKLSDDIMAHPVGKDCIQVSTFPQRKPLCMGLLNCKSSQWDGRVKTLPKTLTSPEKTWTNLQPCMYATIFDLFSVLDHVCTFADSPSIFRSSYQRAEKAQKTGLFDKEIVPLEGFSKHPTTGERSRIIVSKDDGIRYGTTVDALGKIRPAFPQWGGGKTTGGNASQITDGAAAVLLMTRRRAEELGLPVIAKYITTAVSGAFN